MSEKVEAYLCSVCGGLFATEEDAQRCEIRHRSIISYVPNYKEYEQYPSSITVKYEDKIHETYTVTRRK